MRFRALANTKVVSLATYLAILLFNVYTLSLYYNQQLTFYIHPRYITFTLALNAISLVACAVGFFVAAWRMGKTPSKRATAVASPSSSPGSSPGSASSGGWRPSFTVLMAGLVLVAAYALPARTLSSGTADQRSANFNSIQAQPSGNGAGSGAGSGGAGGDTLALFGADTTRLTVADWALAFNLRSTPASYVRKEVDVVGFVFHPKGPPE